MLSHESAGWLWGLLSGCPATVDVTVPTRGHRRSGIRVHHAPALVERDRTTREQIPVTTLARTLLDLAGTGSAKRVERTVERADRLGLLDIVEIDAVLARADGPPGSYQLRQALEIYHDPAFTRSRLERVFLALIRKAKLPRPATNTFVVGHEIDAYWEQERFAVELDGWKTHGTRAAFERDPVRLEELKLAGIDAVRITARRIEREPDRVAAGLERLLAQRRRELGAEN
jgi:very-short-patch-repair endonuclease